MTPREVDEFLDLLRDVLGLDALPQERVLRTADIRRHALESLASGPLPLGAIARAVGADTARTCRILASAERTGIVARERGVWRLVAGVENSCLQATAPSP